MIDYIQITLYLILFTIIYILLKNFNNERELNYANPFFYFLVFLVLYLGIPALFAEEFILEILVIKLTQQKLTTNM